MSKHRPDRAPVPLGHRAEGEATASAGPRGGFSSPSRAFSSQGKGFSSETCCSAQPAANGAVGPIDPWQVRFTQDSASWRFSTGRRLERLQLASGAGVRNPVIFRLSGSSLRTTDWWATTKEILKESWKFSTVNDGTNVFIEFTVREYEELLQMLRGFDR